LSSISAESKKTFLHLQIHSFPDFDQGLELGLWWSYGSWIYNYLCNQCLSPLTLWVWIPLRWGVFDTTLCDKVCQWLAAGRWFSPGTAVSSINKTDRHDITEISNYHTITMTDWILIKFIHKLYMWTLTGVTKTRDESFPLHCLFVQYIWK
jgi:hypothetical protein